MKTDQAAAFDGARTRTCGQSASTQSGVGSLARTSLVHAGQARERSAGVSKRRRRPTRPADFLKRGRPILRHPGQASSVAPAPAKRPESSRRAGEHDAIARVHAAGHRENGERAK
jgi:hypothetical protein